MSELIDNNRKRKELLKHMILRLHRGEAPGEVRKQLVRLMGNVPYGVVVEAEQELIAEGLPQEEVLKLCDIHGEALKGIIDTSGSKDIPPGHPVHTFEQENRALEERLEKLGSLFEGLAGGEAPAVEKTLEELRACFRELAEVDRHYSRKENLLFPYLEKYGITGPSTVMWGKHDEARELLGAAVEALDAMEQPTSDELRSTAELVLEPAARAVDEMIFKEEEILFPMSLDTLNELEWYEIALQSPEIGYCLFSPDEQWRPAQAAEEEKTGEGDGRITLPSGSFSLDELTAILNTLPVDLTFVDRDDRVRWFSQGEERIFQRSLAILGRRVQQCHPPASVDVVQRIVDDFRAGREDRAAFWITLGGKFVHIEYFALRDPEGTYLGTLEVTQDLTEKRKLEGEQRLLSYNRR